MLEVSLGASGLLMFGAVRLLCLIRDWRWDKRAAAIRTEREKARRNREQALAALTVERFRILRLYRTQAEKGVWLVPPSVLLQTVSHDKSDGLELSSSEQISPDVSPGLESPRGPGGDERALERISKAS